MWVYNLFLIRTIGNWSIYSFLLPLFIGGLLNLRKLFNKIEFLCDTQYITLTEIDGVRSPPRIPPAAARPISSSLVVGNQHFLCRFYSFENYQTFLYSDASLSRQWRWYWHTQTQAIITFKKHHHRHAKNMKLANAIIITITRANKFSRTKKKKKTNKPTDAHHIDSCRARNKTHVQLWIN